MTATIAAAQYPITEHPDFKSWENHMESWVSNAAEKGADLLLFPEYGAMELVSIFSEKIRQDIREQVKELNAVREDFCEVFEKLAKKYGTIIIAPSIPVIESGKNLNRAHVFSPAGPTGFQDKFFMTRFENEEWGIESAPKTLTLFEAAWGTFGIQICYDVEFAIGSQQLCEAGASLILAPSCTETIRGATRVHVGARARALENQAYTAVSQTVGNAEWSPAVDINYGYAAFYASPDKGLPEEGILSTMPTQEEGWLIQQLDFNKIDAVRADGAVFNFRDHGKLKTTIHGEEIEIKRKKI